MTTTIVRYTVRPDAADENARLIAEVFAELGRLRPPDLRYLVLRIDGGRFLHIAASASQPSPLSALPSFGRFRQGIVERCLEPPTSESATVLGEYHSVAS